MKKNKKILIDLLAYDPHDGGFTTYVNTLLNTCKKLEGMDFTLLINYHYLNDFEGYTFDKIKIKTLTKGKFYQSLIITPVISALYKFDCIHFGISAVPWFIKTKKTMIVHDLYFLFEEEKQKNWLMNLYWKIIYKKSIYRADKIGAISQTTKEDLRARMGVYGNVEIIYPVIEMKKDISYREFNREKILNLLYVGSIVPRKNLKFIIQALEGINIKWRLNLVGNLWWGMDSLGSPNENISIHGYVSDEQLIEFYRRSEILLCPSLYEGFGVTTLEAISHGCLALTSDIPSFSEYIPKSCRFSIKDQNSVAKIINNLDADSYKSMLSQEIRGIEKFNAPLQIKAYEKLFCNL
jgi:glycosyltransferase involved in cell wall biosynthesis